MNLKIPQKHEPSADSFPVTSSGVKAWLASIEYDGIGGKSKNLYKGLKHSNRLENKPALRVELMELFRPEVCLVINDLERRYLSLSLPLPQKTQQIFDLIIAFLHEMAFGYKIAIEDSVKMKAPLSKKLGALAAQRAISYLSEIMQRCAQLYYIAPNGLWRDIHQLYAYAEKAMQHLRPVKDKQLKSCSEMSVSGAYKRALLFNLARANSLRRGEASQVFNFLETNVAYVKLSKGSESTLEQNLFAVNLASDSPPSRQRFLSPSSSPQIRVLDGELILQKIREELENRPLFDPPILASEKLARTTLERLEVNWGMSFKRKYARGMRNVSLAVELGIKDIHAYIKYTNGELNTLTTSTNKKEESLQLELEKKPFADNEHESFITHPVFSQADNSAKLWQLVESGHSFTPSSMKALNENHDTLANHAQSQKQNWTMLNKSNHGFGLAWEGEGSSQAHIGEVLALKEENKEAIRWSVGVIRWMQFTGKNSFMVGVEILSPAILPIFVQRESNDGKPLEEMSQEALLLPEIKARGQRSSVIVPSYMFAQGDGVDININGRYQQCVLDTLIEQTGDFALFVVELKGKPSNHLERSTENNIDEMDVWKIIS